VAKLIILSIVLMSFAVPIWLSSSGNPRRDLRRAQGVLLAFVFLWAYLCLHVYPAIVPIE
jgi:hypothetical protein